MNSDKARNQQEWIDRKNQETRIFMADQHQDLDDSFINMSEISLNCPRPMKFFMIIDPYLGLMCVAIFTILLQCVTVLGIVFLPWKMEPFVHYLQIALNFCVNPLMFRWLFDRRNKLNYLLVALYIQIVIHIIRIFDAYFCR